MVGNGIESFAGGGRFDLSPPDEEGSMRLVAVAPSVASLLAAGLSGFVAALHPTSMSTFETSGRSVSIRAEAQTVGELFSGLVLALLDRVESMEIGVVSVGVDGIVRSERGQIAWGRLEIAEGTAPERHSISIASAAVNEEESGQLSLEVTLQRD